MSQLLKKYALLAACAVLALFFAMRPVHAQSVAMGGTGEHLLFAYWSTAKYVNTLVAIKSPLGVRNSGEAMNVVRIVIRDAMGKGVADFNTCLMPGDSWTASLSMDGLMVGDPGGCDDAVVQPAASTDREGGNGMMATPMAGEMIPLDADGGYFEAWLNPMATFNDDTIACSATYSSADADAGIAVGDSVPSGTIIDTSEHSITGNMNCVADDRVGDYDKDGLAENATPKNISGMAMLVSAMSGFSSSYNATALTGCGNADDIAANDASINATADDGNGCWVIGTDDDGAPITSALMAQGKDLLTGRWTAINDMNIMSHTKVVLTFPVGNETDGNHQLNHMTTDEDDNEVAGTDPVSVYAFDDMGQVAGQGTAMLGMNVNMCMFDRMDMDDGMDDGMGDGMDMDDGMGDGMDMDDGMPMFYCNDNMDMAVELAGMAGEFRIFNNNADQVNDDNMLMDIDNVADEDQLDDGTEVEGFGTQAFTSPETTEAVRDRENSGQVPEEALHAIGLVFSYFMGTDDQQYDQATSVQWIDIDPAAITASDAVSGMSDDL